MKFWIVFCLGKDFLFKSTLLQGLSVNLIHVSLKFPSSTVDKTWLLVYMVVLKSVSSLQNLIGKKKLSLTLHCLTQPYFVTAMEKMRFGVRKYLEGKSFVFLSRNSFKSKDQNFRREESHREYVIQRLACRQYCNSTFF